MNPKYVCMSSTEGEMWRQSYRDCLKQLESAEIENNNLHKKIAELEDEFLKYRAEELHRNLIDDGRLQDATTVRELLARL
jgi:predicted RNase H-like nuclease (RuvC/YqgF family)